MEHEFARGGGMGCDSRFSGHIIATQNDLYEQVTISEGKGEKGEIGGSGISSLI